MSNDEGNGVGGNERDGKTSNRLTRRRLLKAAGMTGAAFAAAPLLAACGDDSDESSSAGSGSGSGDTTGGGGEASGDIQKILEFIDPVEEEFSGKGTAYEIGLVLAFTGPGSFFGRTMSAGAKLAAEHIKQLGGPDITFSEKDHKSGDPQAGVQAVKELGLDKIPAKLASYVDDLGAMTPGTEQFKMFTFDGGGGPRPSVGGTPTSGAPGPSRPTTPGPAPSSSSRRSSTRQEGLLHQLGPRAAQPGLRLTSRDRVRLVSDRM